MNRSLVVVLAAFAVAGCSSEDSVVTTDAAAADAASLEDATTQPAEASTEDASTTADAGSDSSTMSPFKSCTDAERAASTLFTNGADISFFNAGVDGGALAYTNNCVRIPKGKDVGWYGDFAAHPLENNGESGTPIPNVSVGNDSGRITFPNAGKFSFHCGFHPVLMYGTVLVE